MFKKNREELIRKSQTALQTNSTSEGSVTRRGFITGSILASLGTIACSFLPPQIGIAQFLPNTLANPCPPPQCDCPWIFSGWYPTCTDCDGDCGYNAECAQANPGVYECAAWSMDFIITIGDPGCCGTFCDPQGCCAETGRELCNSVTYYCCPDPQTCCG